MCHTARALCVAMTHASPPPTLLAAAAHSACWRRYQCASIAVMVSVVATSRCGGRPSSSATSALLDRHITSRNNVTNRARAAREPASTGRSRAALYQNGSEYGW